LPAWASTERYDVTAKPSYAFTLRYKAGADVATTGNHDDAPEFATALREQLGLRLQRERTKVPTLVVDSISRPSDN
jgi:uncharacterized protein (TIGR03435 family)